MEAQTLTEDSDESQPIPAGMRYEHGKVVPHLTVEERVARGKAARRDVPRASHAGFPPGAHRPDPVALLEQQAVTRVPELVLIRYGRMLVSAFTFYRGAALIMASDLAGTPESTVALDTTRSQAASALTHVRLHTGGIEPDPNRVRRSPRDAPT